MTFLFLFATISYTFISQLRIVVCNEQTLVVADEEHGSHSLIKFTLCLLYMIVLFSLNDV